ncbi:MAG: alpha/beta hydrolase [Verrucomicrobiales bacterium]
MNRNPGGGRRPFATTLLLLLPPIAGVGCSSLKPYHEVLLSVPANEIVEIEGQRVHVEQAGRGEPLVMLHGFAGSTFEFRKLVPLLSRDHRTVAIDLNGFGYTERPVSPAAYTPEGQLAMIDAVLEKLGISRFHLLGHSYGGSLSLLMAKNEPGRVKSLTLISPATDFGEPPFILKTINGRKFT